MPRYFIAKLAVTLPINAALRACSASEIDLLTSFCFGFTAYVLASIAVATWAKA